VPEELPSAPGSPGSQSSALRASCAGPVQPPAPGSWWLGRYRVVREIGVGGMAAVHLARLDGPGGFRKWVAIKRIHRHLATDETFVRMFLDEARVAARISHPNVAQVFELGKHGEVYWLAMEYLHGEPLRELMRACSDRSLPVLDCGLAAKLVADAAEGLHAAHELRDNQGELLQLVHRDVSPHNIFVTYDGVVKVVDFGIATGAGRLACTRAGTVKGKLAYMSPEQARGCPVDRRTDVFALGVVLWELCTGRRLFVGTSELETLERVQACRVPRPTRIVPSFPVELEEILLRALAADRQERFQTARELSLSLHRYVARARGFVGYDEVGELLRRSLPGCCRARDAWLRRACEVDALTAPRQSGLSHRGRVATRSSARLGPAPAGWSARARTSKPPGGHSCSGLPTARIGPDIDEAVTRIMSRPAGGWCPQPHGHGMRAGVALPSIAPSCRPALSARTATEQPCAVPTAPAPRNGSSVGARLMRRALLAAAMSAVAAGLLALASV
jgi:serine/threonine protein kinase